jgi:hypothetical protein
MVNRVKKSWDTFPPERMSYAQAARKNGTPTPPINAPGPADVAAAGSSSQVQPFADNNLNDDKEEEEMSGEKTLRQGSMVLPLDVDGLVQMEANSAQTLAPRGHPAQTQQLTSMNQGQARGQAGEGGGQEAGRGPANGSVVGQAVRADQPGSVRAQPAEAGGRVFSGMNSQINPGLSQQPARQVSQQGLQPAQLQQQQQYQFRPQQVTQQQPLLYAPKPRRHQAMNFDFDFNFKGQLPGQQQEVPNFNMAFNGMAQPQPMMSGFQQGYQMSMSMPNPYQQASNPASAFPAPQAPTRHQPVIAYGSNALPARLPDLTLVRSEAGVKRTLAKMGITHNPNADIVWISGALINVQGPHRASTLTVAEADYLTKLARNHKILCTAEMVHGVRPTQMIQDSRALDTLRFCFVHALVPKDRVAAALTQLRVSQDKRQKALLEMEEDCRAKGTCPVARAVSNAKKEYYAPIIGGLGVDGSGAFTVQHGSLSPTLSTLGAGESFFEYAQAYCRAELARVGANGMLTGPTQQDGENAHEAWYRMHGDVRNFIAEPTIGYFELVRNWWQAAWNPDQLYVLNQEKAMIKKQTAEENRIFGRKNRGARSRK